MLDYKSLSGFWKFRDWLALDSIYGSSFLSAPPFVFPSPRFWLHFQAAFLSAKMIYCTPHATSTYHKVQRKRGFLFWMGKMLSEKSQQRSPLWPIFLNWNQSCGGHLLDSFLWLFWTLILCGDKYELISPTSPRSDRGRFGFPNRTMGIVLNISAGRQTLSPCLLLASSIDSLCSLKWYKPRWEKLWVHWGHTAESWQSQK